MLHEAAHIVAGNRDQQYGGPEDSFEAIAAHWTAYLARRKGLTSSLHAEDIAAMMTLLKVARLETGDKIQPDTWTDIAGYAACGYEITTKDS